MEAVLGSGTTNQPHGGFAKPLAREPTTQKKTSDETHRDWQFHSPELRIVAQQHVCGPKSVRKPIDRYQRVKFTCHGCLLPCEGFALPRPTAAGLDANTGKDTITGTGHFAYGCLKKFREERRNQYPEQTAGILELMLTRHFGVKEEDLLNFVAPPSRHDLSIYLSESKTHGNANRIYAADRCFSNPPDWAGGWADGYEFHRKFEIAMKPPDPTKLRIVEENATIVAESLQSQQLLQKNEADLRLFFPSFSIKSNQTQRDFTAASETRAKHLREEENRQRAARGQRPVLLAPNNDPSDIVRPQLPVTPFLTTFSLVPGAAAAAVASGPTAKT